MYDCVADMIFDSRDFSFSSLSCFLFLVVAGCLFGLVCVSGGCFGCYNKYIEKLIGTL